MRQYIFIDETGDLGIGSKYFIITAIWSKTPSDFDRIIKNIRRNKFKKKLMGVNELKANNSKKELRVHLLQRFTELEGSSAHSIILDKSKVFSQYLSGNKHKLYNYVCGCLASSLSINSNDWFIRIDKSKSKQTLIKDFDDYIEAKSREKVWNISVKIKHSHSHSWSGLQIADFVSWAVFRKFEFGDSFYYDIIKDKVNVSDVWKK